MPNKSLFKTHKAFLNWWKKYREKNREKLRSYNTQYVREWRAKKRIAGDNSKKR